LSEIQHKLHAHPNTSKLESGTNFVSKPFFDKPTFILFPILSIQHFQLHDHV